VRWYAYLAVRPFPPDLARLMRQAGCVGINFTSDSAHPQMLAAYRQSHRPEHLREAVACCRREGIAVMLDLLLGGPGETEETVAESIRFMKEIEPDCVGASVGMRLYPGTGVIDALGGEEALDRIDGICRHYEGPVDLLRPTFYISPHLGSRPARLVCELIGNDPRFFPPAEENESAGEPASDHNYNDNRRLTDAIAAGARGAYWDILRRLPRDQA
ncbi:MAG: radical SAM protein, partial [Thermoguttaceae bacterium]|nr:radical SAM protein [Thermoguttaceae bacterium]